MSRKFTVKQFCGIMDLPHGGIVVDEQSFLYGNSSIYACWNVCVF